MSSIKYINSFDIALESINSNTQEYKNDFKEFIENLQEHNSSNIPPDQITLKKSFLLYNKLFNKDETGTFCGPCRKRIYKQLVKLYNAIN